MAFSWNPFSRGQSVKQDNQSSSLNPNFSTFSHFTNDIERAVSLNSIVGKSVQQQSILANPIWQSVMENGVIAMPVAANKPERLNQYRAMAKFTETQWCLDEIADEFINEDEHGNFIQMKLPDGLPNLNETRKSILQNEFKKYMNLFDLRDDGYNIIKRFLVEGELCWENVINSDYLKNGIIGVKFIPAEYYVTLIDKNTGKPCGVLFDPKSMSRDIYNMLTNNYVNASSVFNAIIPVTANFTLNTKECVPMLWSQLTYISSGEYALEGDYVPLPLIERSKQAYYQLSLLQDAAVILRVTRAPERLLFNISTGKMTQNYADEYVRNFANNLKSRKTATPNGQDVTGTYNPVSMLESYIFGKSDGNDGTSVESVNSSAQYDQMEDIKYFFKRFVKQFKVPFSRFEQPENAKPGDGQMPQEEFSFLQMIVRFQRRFADGFKRGFITHLKLRDIWDKYELNESMLDIAMVKPQMYDLYTRQKMVETKMATYKVISENDEFSKITAMKKYLGMSDAEVNENFANLAKEKCLTEIATYWSGKITSDGPAGEYDIPPIPIKGISDKNEDKDESGSEGESDESGEESSDETSEEDTGSEDENKEEKSEEPPPPATFGLG